MNIQKILDNPPEKYAYTILKPHKRTINKSKIVSFDDPILFIAKIKQKQLQALYVFKYKNQKFFPFFQTTSGGESCLPVDFYTLNFENKYDCLNQAIDAYFNSSLDVTQYRYNLSSIINLGEPYFRGVHEHMGEL